MALGLPVVVAQVSELFLNRREGTPLEAVEQAGYRYGGREVHQQAHVPGIAVELGQFGTEFRAHVRHDQASAPGESELNTG